MMSRHFRLSSELTGAIAKRLAHAKNQLSAPGSFFNQFVTDIQKSKKCYFGWDWLKFVILYQPPFGGVSGLKCPPWLNNFKSQNYLKSLVAAHSKGIYYFKKFPCSKRRTVVSSTN